MEVETIICRNINKQRVTKETISNDTEKPSQSIDQNLLLQTIKSMNERKGETNSKLKGKRAFFLSAIIVPQR